jgi:hypothetical protein
MELSQKAISWLRSQERVPAITDRQRIIGAIQRADAPVFEPVLQFQKNYGGLVLYAGDEPLAFGILHLTTRTYWQPETVGARFEHDIWYFECCNTCYQMEFSIDQNGCYLEDGDPIASSFDKFIEWMAMGRELISVGWRIAYDSRFKSNELAESLIQHHGLCPIPEASDKYSEWWLGDNFGLRKKGSEWCHIRKVAVTNEKGRFS